MIDWSAYPNFTADEFACKCGCGTNEIRDALVSKIQTLRTRYGRPIIISSGYRCPNHPAEIRKSKPGTHSLGLAADIVVSRSDAHRLLKIALDLGFTGVGVQQKGAGRFIHLDLAPGTPAHVRPTVWSY